MDKERKEISGDDSMADVIMMMSEGNPGAIRVLADMCKVDHDKGILRWLALDDMNIRGTQIWIGFKEHCLEDMDTFLKCIDDRDGSMVNTINAEGRRGNHTHFAVQSGASGANRKHIDNGGGK